MVVCSLNCPYCDTEIVNEDAIVCPKCGESLASEGELVPNSPDAPETRTDLLLVAGILTIIAAAFTSSMGYLAIDQYNVALSDLSFYAGATASDFLGFLILGILRIIASAVALIGSIFILLKKRFKISILGAVFPIVSVLGTYIIIQQYKYAYITILVFSDLPALILAIFGMILVLRSKVEFI